MDDIWDDYDREEYIEEDIFYCDSCGFESTEVYQDRDMFGGVFFRCLNCGAYLDC